MRTCTFSKKLWQIPMYNAKYNNLHKIERIKKYMECVKIALKCHSTYIISDHAEI